MNSTFRTVCLATVIALTSSAVAQESDTLAQLDAALQSVTTFQMGDNSRALQDVERIVFQLPADSELRDPIEQRLLRTLNSDATVDAKRFLCTQLRVIGTPSGIASLERLLVDPELSHAARYALGRMEFTEASEALLRALDRTSGDLQAGVIDTLGNRKCTAARSRLIQLLGGSDATVAAAAAIALGRLGDEASIAALQAARSNASEAVRAEIDNALLNAAEQLAGGGQAEQAAAIYRAFYKTDENAQLRCAGLRGLVITQPDQSGDLLAAAIRSDDASQRRYAISLTRLAADQQTIKPVVDLLPSLAAEDQVLMLRALGTRGDSSAAAVIAEAIDSDTATVRSAALEALGNVGDARHVLTLAAAAGGADGREANVARAALAALSGGDVDQRLLAELEAADAAVRVELIRGLAARGVSAAVTRLLQIAGGQDPAVRRAAIEALGTLAEKPHLPALVRLAATSSQGDQAASIEAVSKLFSRIEDKSQCAAPVLAELSQASAASKPVLIRLLGRSGAADALPTIREALRDSDSALQATAVTALAQWPDPSVAPDLLTLMNDGQYAQHKQTVLDGYLRLAVFSDDPGAMYMQALQRVDQVNDKKAVLEGLGLTSESTEGLDVALEYLDDSALQAAAGIAAMRIAYRLRNRDESRARDALKQVLAKVDHPDVQQRTREVLNELDKYEDHILQWVTAGPFQESGQDGAAIYRTVFPPEEDPDAADWRPLTKGIGSWEINLESTYGGLDFVAAYLRTSVWSEGQQDVQLELGSDDGIKVWLNGELLYDQWREGGAAPRQKLVRGTLQKGWNDLMLKVVDQQGGWVGACRIRKPDGAALEGLKYDAELKQAVGR